MNDINTPCARETNGVICGAPPAWHTTTSTIEDLRTRLDGHHLPQRPWYRVDRYCLGEDCTCTGYVAPEPPKTAYVMEMGQDELLDLGLASPAWGRIAAGKLVPLAEYLPGHVERCPYCSGHGAAGYPVSKCARCHGSGFVLKGEAAR